MSFTELYCDFAAGANINAGYPLTGGIYPYTKTNGGWNSGTGVFTPAAGDPQADGVQVGDMASVYIDGATTAVFVGRVTAVNATTITVSTSAKSGTAPTTNATARSITVGGTWKGPNAAEAFPFGFVQGTQTNAAADAPRVNFKNNDVYDVTAAMTHNQNGLTIFEGYSSSPGDGGRAVIDGGTAGVGYNLLTVSGTVNVLKNLDFTNNGASSTGLGVNVTGNFTNLYNVRVAHIRQSAFTLAGQHIQVVQCEAFDANQNNSASMAGFNVTGIACNLQRCISHNNTGSNTAGFLTSASTTVFDTCIADTNGQDGFRFTSGQTVQMQACTAYGNASDGLEIALGGGAHIVTIENCVFANNGTTGVGYGVNGSGSSSRGGVLNNCGFYANEQGQHTGLKNVVESNTITFAAQPMADPANGDFEVVQAAGKAAGMGTFLQDSGTYSDTTVSRPDIGAVQHTDQGAVVTGSTAVLSARGRQQRTYSVVGHRVPRLLPGEVTITLVHIPIAVPTRTRTVVQQRPQVVRWAPMPRAPSFPIPVATTKRLALPQWRPTQMKLVPLPVQPGPPIVLRSQKIARYPWPLPRKAPPLVINLPPTVIVNHPKVVR